MMRARILDLSSNDTQLIFDCFSKKNEEQSNINRKRIEYQSNIRGRIYEATTTHQRRINDASTSLRRLPLRLKIQHLIGAVVQEGIHIDVRGVAVETVGVLWD